MNDASNAMTQQVLKALGLDTVCIQVYLMMHSAPEADMVEIAERLSLQPPEVIDALDELSDLTLLRPGVTPKHPLRPVSIERAIQLLLRQQSEQLQVQAGALNMLQAAMKELLETRPAGESELGLVDIVQITGIEPAQLHLEQLALRAVSSFYSSMNARTMSAELLEASRAFDEEICQRVQVHSLYQNAIKNDRRSLEYVRWFAGLGAEIRFLPVVPVRMVIIDQATGVLFRKENQLPMEMFVIREPAVLQPIIELFEMSWGNAESLDVDSKQPAENMPSAQELALLRLLATGGTDEAAGKKLGVSVRTVRRIMADLMERLEASSRFEAGHKATQRGWL